MDIELIDFLAPIILLTAWYLDLRLGDPASLPHPIVYMGRWIAFGEKRLNHGSHRKAKGAVFAIVSIAATFGLFGVIFHFSFFTLHSSLFHFVLGAILLFFCLAGNTLRSEVRMVFEALERSLDDGRKQVARIVGRDTANLSAQEVRTAALETLAENLSDGVIAPLFWFCLLGIPGAMAYKMVNTLDSMIGYQNPRYKDFGCWAAKIDDVANFIPARLTALLILIASGKPTFTNIAFVLKYGKQHASPNSGWPEAALASVLDCRFGGTHDYFGEQFYKPYIGTNPRPLTFADMKKSITVCFLAEVLAVLVCLCIMMIGILS